jgi:GAF domain
LPEAEKSLGKINYMRAIPKERATAEQLSMIQFGKPPDAEYSHILLLEQYTLGTITPKFALPVHCDEQRCLPGAPTAFLKNRPVAVVASRIEFAADVPRRTRNEITAYFKQEKFRSFLSVPMQRGDEIVGVVNIEAKTAIFDPRDLRVNVVAESLHPLCMSLAYLVT